MRVAALLLAPALVAADWPLLPYRALPDDVRVYPARPRHPLGPLIGFRELPVDDRIAPDDFVVLDDLTEPVPDAAQQRALDARVAALLPRQDYAPRPALWRIRDRDTTIWLFGTIHVLPPGFRWRSAAVERAAAAAHTLIVESVDEPGASPGASEAFAVAGLPPLARRVSPSHRAKLADFVATLPPEAARTLDTLPTWVAAVAISVARDIRAGEVPGPGADDWFEAEFRRRDRRVVGIEDGTQVMATANSIPEGEARALLDAALDAPPFDRALARAPLHAWARGELGPAVTVALGSPALSVALLDRRNAAWAATLKAKLAVPGTLFFAAGAGHFAGRGSVLDELAARGVRVERVE